MKHIILKYHEIIHLRDTGSVIAWRVVKPQPEWRNPVIGCDGVAIGLGGTGPEGGVRCPYGRTGEERWVKETFRFDGIDHLIGIARQDRSEVVYKSDLIGDRMIDDCPWTPSTHMPRWASRFTVTLDVGLKRIQEVTEEEAKMSTEYRPSGTHLSGIWELLEQSNPGSWDRNDYFWSIKCTLTK